MARSFKTLGLALMAVLALSAVAASHASAAKFTSGGGYPQTILGEDVGANDKTTISNGPIICNGETYKGTITAATSTLLVTPNYINCRTEGAAFDNVTKTHNGCNLEFTVTATQTKDIDKGTVHLRCPGPKWIENHHYTSGVNHAAGTSSCTNTLHPQTFVGDVQYTSETANKDLLVHGSMGFDATTHGSCSFGFTLTMEASYDFSVTFKTESGAALHVG